jgi:hypothetical protein
VIIVVPSFLKMLRGIISKARVVGKNEKSGWSGWRTEKLLTESEGVLSGDEVLCSRSQDFANGHRTAYAFAHQVCSEVT